MPSLIRLTHFHHEILRVNALIIYSDQSVRLQSLSFAESLATDLTKHFGWLRWWHRFVYCHLLPARQTKKLKTKFKTISRVCFNAFAVVCTYAIQKLSTFGRILSYHLQCILGGHHVTNLLCVARTSSSPRMQVLNYSMEKCIKRVFGQNWWVNLFDWLYTSELNTHINVPTWEMNRKKSTSWIKYCL